MSKDKTTWFCDASGQGWAVCTNSGELIAQDRWKHQDLKHCGLSFNVRHEAYAAEKAVRLAIQQGVKKLYLYTDCIGVIHWKRAQGLKHIADNGMTLRLKWIRSKNNPADKWTRKFIKAETQDDYKTIQGAGMEIIKKGIVKRHAGVKITVQGKPDWVADNLSKYGNIGEVIGV